MLYCRCWQYATRKEVKVLTNGTLLKIALVRSNMTALALCEKCGFSAAYFYKCLRGEQDFRTDEVKAICQHLNIGLEEMSSIFFTGDVGNMPRNEE